eukprot:Protomagalhaensia_sp_Gyna_25__5474@NODE_723_length_2763_cov_114_133627_g563_i0_p2_GENE_NODE_723_length_2763_cov_114_133627_g563_i0NODE_723_length_2763_cov_114_133627_g563_i0_p2_ORF_typecomplete_len138_score18_70_NODE_723_length_2763_cov_114_133627_g563_i017992212
MLVEDGYVPSAPLARGELRRRVRETGTAPKTGAESILEYLRARAPTGAVRRPNQVNLTLSTDRCRCKRCVADLEASLFDSFESMQYFRANSVMDVDLDSTGSSFEPFSPGLPELDGLNCSLQNLIQAKEQQLAALNY